MGVGCRLHQAISSLRADPRPRQQHLAQGLVLCSLPCFVVALVAITSSGAVLLVVLLPGQQLSTGQADGMSVASLHCLLHKANIRCCMKSMSDSRFSGNERLKMLKENYIYFLIFLYLPSLPLSIWLRCLRHAFLTGAMPPLCSLIPPAVCKAAL